MKEFGTFHIVVIRGAKYAAYPQGIRHALLAWAYDTSKQASGSMRRSLR